MGGIAQAIVPIIGAVGGLFGSRGGGQSMPAAPSAPDTSAVDQKAKADEERNRRIAAEQNKTRVTGGGGLSGDAQTQTPTLLGQ